jgi:Tfp pilus assembly protein PilO
MWTLQSQIGWVNRARWALAAAVVLLLAAFWFFGYRPQTAQLATLRRLIGNEERELAAGKTQTSILPTVAADVKNLQTRLQRAKSMPRQQELPAFIRDIWQLADQAALRKFYLTPGVPAREERFNQLPVKLTFEGDFVSVYSFLKRSEEFQRLIRVRGLNVKSKDKQGQVGVQLTMNIYFASE